MSNPNIPQPEPLLVACLCAQWCGTCKDYAPLFEGLQAEFPQARFRWIDIEDESDLVDPMEVEDFPTLLITSGGQARFFGPVMPHVETIRRLIQAQQGQSGASRLPSEVQALAQRVGRAKA
ncbi:MAG: thioredoxin family protein [Rhodoferax sp.]|nr:thioredoxin family protein [Rhodoferax sp.]